MGLKWEVAPSLPQEPNYFSGWSSQKVCIQVSDTDLLSLWTVKNDITEYEAKKQFINGIVKNNITKKDIQTFIETPLKYKKQPG